MENNNEAHVFPATQWSVVLAAGDDNSVVASHALAELCQRYWFPLFAFVRRRGKNPEEAKDLTQGFFVQILEKGTFSRADPDRGRFRSFLLGSMKNYLLSDHRSMRAGKRGGGIPLISIDEEMGEAGYHYDPEDGDTPETIFQRAWANQILDEAIERLRLKYRRSGKEDLFDILEPYLYNEDGESTYKEKSEETGLSVSAITSAVFRMKKYFSEVLRETIGQTVGSPNEIDDELKFLMASLGAK